MSAQDERLTAAVRRLWAVRDTIHASRALGAMRSALDALACESPNVGAASELVRHAVASLAEVSRREDVYPPHEACRRTGMLLSALERGEEPSDETRRLCLSLVVQMCGREAVADDAHPLLLAELATMAAMEVVMCTDVPSWGGKALPVSVGVGRASLGELAGVDIQAMQRSGVMPGGR